MSTVEGNGKPLQHSCPENPIYSMQRQKDMTQKDELPRLVSAQYVTGEEWRNSSKRNEEAERKQKQCPVWMGLGIEAKRAILHKNLEC